MKIKTISLYMGIIPRFYIVLFIASISFQSLFAKDNTSDLIFFEDFSKWNTPGSLSPEWNCKGNIFPENWEPANREKRSSFTARVIESGSGKDGALWLTGRIKSKELFNIQDREMFRVSFRAKGADGSIIVELNEIGTDRKKTKALVEVCKFKTEAKWRNYSTKIKILPFSVRYGKLEVVGKNVIIDDIKINKIIERKAEKPPLPEFVIPLVKRNIDVDGKMEHEEWKGSVGMERPFVNIGTGLTVNRLAEFRMFSDGKVLNIYVRANNYKRGFISNAKKKDGDVFQDDSLEFYFNPYLGEKRPVVVYFIAINSKGVVLDMAEKTSIAQYERNWECRGLKTKCRVVNDVWFMEMSVPLDSVGLKADMPFGFNISRNMLFPQEFSNLTGDGYKNYLRMAKCLIKPSPGIFWNFYSNRGEVKQTVHLMNTFEKEYDVETMMLSEFKKRNEQKRTIRLEPNVGKSVKMSEFEGYSAKGNVALCIKDNEGNPLFKINRKLVLGARTTPVSEDSFDSGSRNFVDYYPAQKKINILFKDKGDKNSPFHRNYAYTSVFISYDGKQIFNKDIYNVTFAGDDAHVTFPFNESAEGTYKLKAAGYNKKGDCIAVAYGDFNIKNIPWLKNSLGKDRIVIPPFTPLEVDESTVSCWGRKYTFGENALPVKIISQGRGVISAPIEITAAFQRGEEQKLTVIEPCGFEGKSADKVIFSAILGAKNIKMRIKGSMEYDGMVRYNLELLSDKNCSVDSLTLVLPLTELKYMHTSANRRSPMIYMTELPAKDDFKYENVPIWQENYDYSKQRRHTLYFPEADGLVWSSKGIKSKNIQGDFLSFFWIGNSKTGLFWCADNDYGWNCTQNKPRFKLFRKDGDGTFHIDFINKNTIIRKKRKLSFGLAATPIRPHIKGANVVIKTGSEGFNNPNMQGIQGIRFRNDDLFFQKKFREHERKRGIPAHLYFANDLLARNDPMLNYMGKEWFTMPYFELGAGSATAGWLERRFSSDQKDYSCAYTSAVPSRTDYYVYWIDKYMKNKAIDGIYLDNSFPAATTNIHQGECGGYVMPDGTVQGGYSLFEMRNMLKRIAVLANKYECTPRYVSIHITGATMPGIFSFSEWWLDGEDLYRDDEDFMDYWKLPILEVQGAGAMGGNLAWMPLAIKSWGNPTPEEKKKSRTALAALKLFDINVVWGKIDYKFARKIQLLEKEFGIDKPDCKFIGYWDENSTVIQDLPKGVKCSCFVRPGKGALIYITNFNRQASKFSPKIDLSRYGLTEFSLIDAENGEPINVDKSIFKLEIDKRDFRMLKIQNKK